MFCETIPYNDREIVRRKGSFRMFVCTVKASSIKFFAAILVSALLLVGIVSIIPIIDVSGKTAIASFDYKNV